MAGDEQARPSELPHDQLARLQCGPEAARLGSLIWFDPEMEGLAAPSGRRGRPATFSDTAIQTCLMLKALFGLPLRQTTGLVASLLKLAKLDGPVPDFSTLCRRQNDLTVTIPCRQSSGALHLLVDSTGIKVMGEGEWSEVDQTTVRGTVVPPNATARCLAPKAVVPGSPGHRRADAGGPRDRG